MNKKKVIILGLILIVIVVVLVIFLCNGKKEELTLTYKSNGGVPYEWQYEIMDTEIVTLVKSYVKKDGNNGKIVGAPIYTNYVFKGLKKGETTITFKYVNITDGSVWKREVNKVKVDSENKISLVSKESKEDIEYNIDEAMEELYKYFNNEEGLNFNYLDTVWVSNGDKYYKFDVRRHNEIVNSRLDIYYIGASKESLAIYDSELFKKTFGTE